MATPVNPVPEPVPGATTGRPRRRFRRESPALIAPDALPADAQGGSARFLLSVAVVLAATVAAAYFANQWIVGRALEHHRRNPQLTLSAAMGGLFAGGLAALIAILIVTNIGKVAGKRP